MAANLGNNLELGKDPQGRPVILSKEKRSTHLYVVGSTGTGKSKFLEHLIRQDIKNWRDSKCGMLVIDPHGSLYDSLMERMTYENSRLKRPIVPIDLRSDEWIVAYNMLRNRPGADPSVVAANFVQAMAYVWGEGGTTNTPLFARWGNNILRTLYEAKRTLVEAEHLIDHSAYAVRRTMTDMVTNPSVQRDWRNAEKMTPQEYEKEVGSTVNRLRRFLGTEMLRQMFGQAHVSLDLEKALSEGQIILVNLAPRGSRVSEEDAALFATLLLSDLWAAAKDRGKGNAAKPVKPFYVYIDEFQNFVTPTIAQGLDQARGFGLHLTLAHQYPNQLLHKGDHGRAIYDSVMVNARTKVVFQVEGEENLKPLAHSLFMGVLNPDEIKLELYSTKIVGHRKELRESHTESSSVTENWSEGSGKMLGDESEGQEDRLSEHSSSSSGSSAGYSKTYMEVDAAVFGKERSQVQFRNLEEQKFQAMAQLFALEPRTCIARMANERLPVLLWVPEVRSYHLNPERVKGYMNLLAKKWKFFVPVAGVVLNENSFIETTQKAMVEPRTAKRKIV